MKTPRLLSRLALTLFLLFLNPEVSTLSAQGNLTPPGAPAATMKTLDQLDAKLDPRRQLNASNTPGDADSVYHINSPGSYYLTDDLVVPAGKSGIEIASSNVTIDLSGYSITSASTLVTIRLTVGGQSNISIRHGHIGSGGGGGIDILPSSGGAPTVGGSVENVHVTGTGGTGIRVGEAVVIKGCSASNNTGDGFRTGLGCTIANCSALRNSGDGFNILTSSITDCSAYGNADTGILANNSCTITKCSARNNTSYGFSVGSGSTVIDCAASNNTLIGILTGSGNIVAKCSAVNNSGGGISVGSASTVSNCSAYLNDASGISTGNACTVTDCSAYENALDGIVCTSVSMIRGNTCFDNGNVGDGAGIHATSSNNRIEGNNCTGADRGIDVDAAANVIIKNTCANNTTNWAIAANNVFGPIIDRTSFLSFAVAGDAAASTLGSTDANANYSY